MVTDMPLCTTLAATKCGLTLQEALWGATRGGAKALALTDRGGLLETERADFIVLNHTDWRSICYFPGNPPMGEIFVKGKPVWRRTA
jgi:imidazolonepropionase